MNSFSSVACEMCEQMCSCIFIPIIWKTLYFSIDRSSLTAVSGNNTVIILSMKMKKNSISTVRGGGNAYLGGGAI